jgi:hypothetical protein
VSASASDRIALGQAVASFQSLLALDHAWTGLAQAESLSTDERHSLIGLVADIVRQLEQAEAGAAWVQDFVLRTGTDHLRAALQSTAEAVPDLEPEIRAIDEEFGSQIGELTESGYGVFTANVGRQQQILVEELGRLLSAVPSDGDLLQAVLCGLSALTIVGGIVSTVLPPHAHGVAITAAGAKAFKTFKCNFERRKKPRGKSFKL